MAGIEVAGLILGALPILLKSVDAYRDGFRRFGSAFKKRKHVEKLARALVFQQQTLEELIKSVAIDSGCEDPWTLEDDPVYYLKSPDVQRQVEEFLGPKNTVVLIDELMSNYEATKKTARCISGLIPSKQGPTDDLVAIINANQDKPNLLADLSPRVKLMLGITDLKAMIREIDEGSQRLHRFSSLAISNSHAMGSDSSRKTLKLAKAFRHIRKLAGGLYEAVLDGFLDECHDDHEARLYLDDRIEIAQKILHSRNTVGSITPSIHFHLVFHADDQKGDLLFYETPVQVLDEHSTDQSSNSPPAHSATSAVTFRMTRSPPDTASRPGPQVATINNWIAQTWSKQMVFFLVPGRPTSLTRPAQVDLSRPFVACKFSGSARGRQDRAFLDPKSALLELGILLLEIWHGVTLESRFGLDETWGVSASYYKRLVLALEWQDDEVNPMLGFYAQAVAHCLTGNTGAAKDLSWDDVKIWAAVCANVVEPLSKLCDDF